MKKLTVEQKRNRIIAYDIISIIEDAERGDYNYLHQLMRGDGTSLLPAGPMSEC